MFSCKTWACRSGFWSLAQWRFYNSERSNFFSPPCIWVEVMESEASIRHAVRLLPRAAGSLWWRPRPWPDTYLLLCDPSHCHLGYCCRLQTVSVFVYTGLRMGTSAGQNVSAHVNTWMSSRTILWVFFFFDDLEKCLSSHPPDPPKLSIVSPADCAPARISLWPRWQCFQDQWALLLPLWTLLKEHTAYNFLFYSHCGVISLLTHIAVGVKSDFSKCVSS